MVDEASTTASGVAVGDVIGGKYSLVRRIGAGGVAEVFEAVHQTIGQHFALKMLKREFAAIPEVAERFLMEARAASKIRHPGVVQIYDIGKHLGGTPYLVMELLQGESLASVLWQKKKLLPTQAVGVMLHVLDVLEAAHAEGVIHRDLKPENVFLTRGPDGEPWAKVIDFGIARLRQEGATASRLTAQGAVMGTPLYMAPEQAASTAEIDGRADIYAAGVMLFEMLTGRPPFLGASPAEVLTKVLSAPFPAARAFEPTIPQALDDVIQTATARKRAARYPSAAAFADALRPLRPDLVAVQLLSMEEEAQLPPGETTGMRRLEQLVALGTIPKSGPIVTPMTNVTPTGLRAVRSTPATGRLSSTPPPRPAITPASVPVVRSGSTPPPRPAITPASVPVVRSGGTPLPRPVSNPPSAPGVRSGSTPAPRPATTPSSVPAAREGSGPSIPRTFTPRSMGSVRPASIPAPLADTTPVSTPPGWQRTTPESLAATAPVSALDSRDGHPSSPRLPAAGKARTRTVPPVAPEPVVIAISRRLLIAVVAIVLAVSAGIGVTLALVLGHSSSGQAGGSPEPSAVADGAADSSQASPEARVTVKLVDVPAGAEMTVDGQPVGAEFQLEASVQERALRVEVPGQRPFVRVFRPVADLTISVRMERAVP